MSMIKRIVLTGGPCGGKTLSLPYLSEKLRNYGWRVFIVPEVATTVLNGIQDMNYIVNTKPDLHDIIQDSIFRQQVNIENEIFQLAGKFVTDESDELNKCVILIDRGLMDIKAYSDKSFFEKLQFVYHLNTTDIHKRYDAVIHLVSVALGAEDFYTKINNLSRRENIEEARIADTKTRDCWLGHPKLRVINNSTDFKGKLKKLLSETLAVLGDPVPLEIERKFILFDKPDLKGNNVVSYDVSIEQMYIESFSDKEEERIRKRGRGNSFAYYKTTKIPITNFKRQEIETEINAIEYERLSYKKLKDTRVINKTRHFFVYKDQYFELDEFHGFLEGLFILELELTEENSICELPEFLGKVEEVTEDPFYKNFNLAHNKSNLALEKITSVLESHREEGRKKH